MMRIAEEGGDLSTSDTEVLNIFNANIKSLPILWVKLLCIHSPLKAYADFMGKSPE